MNKYVIILSILLLLFLYCKKEVVRNNTHLTEKGKNHIL